MKVEEMNDQGVANLLCMVITTAREDFFRAWDNVKSCSKLDPSNYARKQALRGYEFAKQFFYSDLFVLASPVSGDEYIRLLIREAEERHA